MKFPDRSLKKVRKTAYMAVAGIAVLFFAAGGILHLNWASAAETEWVSEGKQAKYNITLDLALAGFPSSTVRSLLNYTQAPPSDPYLVSASGLMLDSYTNANGGTYYCSSGDAVYLKNWNPTAQYELSTWAKNGIEESYTKNNSSFHITFTYSYKTMETSNTLDYSNTYYIISDTEVDGAKLQKEFMEYVRDKKAQKSTGSYYVKDGSSNVSQLIFEEANGDTTGYFYGFCSSSSYMTKTNSFLNQWMKAFLEEKGAKVYDSNIGIKLEERDTNAVITVIRANINRVNWKYQRTTSLNGTGWNASDYTQYLCTPLITASSCTVQMKQDSEMPIVQDKNGIAYQDWNSNNKNRNSVFKDTEVVVTFDENKYNTQDYEIGTYLSNTDYSLDEVASMNNYRSLDSGASLELEGKKYLYVITRPKTETSAVRYFTKYYEESSIHKYVFEYDIEKTPGKITIQPEDGTDSVDVGDKVVLTNTNTEAVNFYTTGDSYPKFTRYSGKSNVTIQQLEKAAVGKSGVVYLEEMSEQYNFLRVNGFWYSCTKEVKKYTDAISVGEELRENRRVVIRAMAVQEGYEMGDDALLSLPYSLKKTVETPVADKTTEESAPTEINMGDTISFLCTTYGSELFYTTDGNAPMVTTEKQENGTVITVPGNSSTKKYDESSGVIVTEDFATYGSNVSFMVKAVYYENGVQTMRDSAVARFVYYVGKQSPVEPVTAVPETNTTEPTVVSVKDKILLYCKTQDTVIYYTIDGTEPVRNADGSAAENTLIYNAAEGIVVPKQQDTFFTITAMAYAEGLASSDTVRFVYKYPPAVASPYAAPGSGTVAESTNVVLKSSTEGAVIYYELAYDGAQAAEPTENSNVYVEENPITISRDTSIKAIAVKDGVSSTVNSFHYTVSTKLSVPTASIASGSVIARGTSITLTADEGATVYYTTDGSNPADSENTNVNIGTTVFLDGTAGSVITIRTYAAKTGYSNSEIANYSYTVSNYENAIFADKESGTVMKNGETVTLNTDVTGAVIYYTLDGSMPTTASLQGNVVTITGASGSTVVLKAIAVLPEGGRTAAVANFTYTITNKLKAPQSNVPSGAIFTEEGEVVLTAETGTIYYTIDGTTPNRTSNVFGGTITINRGMTIKAIAVSEDADDSDISTYVYQFADQVAMPEVSQESGQLDMGTEVTLSCDTADAVIYYTVNGTDPDPDNPGDMLTYTGPIQVNRAMTLKAVAVKSGMSDSKILNVGYTVKEPVVEEEGAVLSEEEISIDNFDGRLKSRSTFEGASKGPSYEDIILKNATYGILVSSNFDVIPENTELTVNRYQIENSAGNLVRQTLGEYYQLVSGYDVTLTVNGEEVQPDGTIEIGLPIPAEYENTLLYLVYVSEDGTIEVLETRRSGGMAYAKVTHLSQYAIAAPVLEEQEQGSILKKVVFGAGVVLVVAVIVIVIVRRQRKYYDK